MKKTTVEPIAIVGMACRFPGAPTLDDYWTLLREGRDAVTEVPAGRWDADAVYDPDSKAPGKANTRRGGFIEDIEQFDAAFFGITPREAAQMDPQQRLLLELAHDALEDAGIAPSSLAGSDTAVFVGAMTNDYFRQQVGDGFRRIDVHTGSGAGLCMLANRLSYQFDLRGPSVTVDTACSSSLVAVYQACQALWAGQSRAALAAGVNVMLDPAINVFYAKAGLSAPDARCKTFSAAADGIGRAEGAAVVVLKRLKDAIADGDPIYAMVRGGAVNHDGRSNGLTQPNRWAQEQLLREAFRHARVDPRDVQYVELHGTGTLIGDPIEANALGAVLAGNGEREPCLVGSVKTNFGHLEAAAGIAGLIKLALAIAKGEVPPSLWFDAPNPHIDFDALPLRVNDRLSPWLASGGKRLGGVSSFGLGGANAHLVLQSAPPQPVPARRGRVLESRQCLLLSARSETALHASIRATQRWLAMNEDASLPAVCASSVRRRNIHPFRLAVLGADREEILAGLQAAAISRAHPGVVQGRFRPSGHDLVLAVPDLGLVNRALLSGVATFPIARQAWMACRNVFARHGVALPTVDKLGEGIRLSVNAPGFRPWHFSAQYALTRQVLAGAPSLQCVLADGLGQLAVLCALGALDLGEIPDRLGSDAYAVGETFTYPVACDFSSGPNPRRIDCARDGRAALWRQRLASSSLGGADLIVLGPESSPLNDSAQLHAATDHASDWTRAFANLAIRHPLAWQAWAPEQPFVRLPSYPWQRQAHWLAAGAPSAAESACGQVGQGPSITGDDRLLGARADLPTPAWRRPLTPQDLPYLSDHAVQGTIILPGAGYVELGLAVQAQIGTGGPARMADLQFHSALVIDAQDPPQLHVALDQANGQFSVHSRKHDEWELHALGRIEPADGTAPANIVLADLQAQCTRRIDAAAHYEDMAARGFGYGPAFRGVDEIWTSPDGERALARIVRPGVLPSVAAHERMHPALFDASLQSMLATLTARGDRELYIPTGIGRLTWYRALPAQFWCHGGLRHAGNGRIEGDIVLFDGAGEVLAQAQGVAAQALTRQQRAEAPEPVFYGWKWDSQVANDSTIAGHWLLVDEDGQSTALAAALRAAGAQEVGEVGSAQLRAAGDEPERAVECWVNRAGVSDLAGVVYVVSEQGDGSPAAGDAYLPLLALIRSLARTAPSTRLVVVTRNLQNAVSQVSTSALSRAACQGLTRVATNEFPSLRVRLVDAAMDLDLRDLAREVLADSRENEVALSANQRLVPRLRPLDVNTVRARSRPIRADASYLITGGYGGFGLEMADWLVAHGARHLVLVGRGGAGSEAVIARIEALRERGVDVLELRADIADALQVAAMLQQIRDTRPPLAGVFHAAAVLDDAPLDQLTAAQIDRAASAKANGAWHLHRLTAADALDHFVLFSSIASLLGGAGQGSYAMACAYLDALARLRRSQGLVGLSINWGALAEVGMAQRFGEVGRYLEGTGVGMFTPAEAMRRLADALQWSEAELGVARMDWARWAASYPAWAASPRYAALVAAPVDGNDAGASGRMRHALLDLPPGTRDAQITQALCEVLAAVMETAPDDIDCGVPLPSLGLDSLLAMDVLVAIEDRFGVKIPMLALMKGNSLTQVAALVGEGLGAAGPGDGGKDRPPRLASLAEIQDLESAERMIARLGELADEEVERLLQQITEEEATR